MTALAESQRSRRPLLEVLAVELASREGGWAAMPRPLKPRRSLRCAPPGPIRTSRNRPCTSRSDNLNDRHAGCDCRKVATQIRRRGQIVDLALRGNTGSAHISDRDAREFELVLFLVFAVVKGTVTPGVSDADSDRTSAEPHVGGRYGSLRDRGCGGGSFCRRRNAGHEDDSKETQKCLVHGF